MVFSFCLLAGIGCDGSQACPEPDAGDCSTGRGAIRDERGRALILHGLNNLSAAKGAARSDARCNNLDEVLPLSESDVEREVHEWGFNSVRYLISWACVEPEKGVFDEEYLRQTAVRVAWYAARGAHVILDMHQDLYGVGVYGNGAPRWATETGGLVPKEIEAGPWWLQATDPAVIAALKNFWEYDEHRYLQDHYIQAWQKVAEHFKGDPAVIGYDVMNEPYGGSLTGALDGSFERDWLAPFYRRLVPAIRQFETQTWLFYEPLPFPITVGQESSLPRIHDSLGGDQRLVYAPHLYPFDIHEGGGYTKSAMSQLDAWVLRRTDEIAFQRTPLYVGEFGGEEGQEGGLDYFRDLMRMFDRMKANWALWSGDPGGWGPVSSWHGSETGKTDLLVRPYPWATAGDIEFFSFNEGEKVFEMRYEGRSDIEGPTEIFIPIRHYPNGFDLTTSDRAGRWREDWDARRAILSFWHDPDSPVHTVRIASR